MSAVAWMNGAVAAAAVVTTSVALALPATGGEGSSARSAARRAVAPRAVAAAVRTGSVTWCGTDESAADRKPDVEVSSASQIHVVYALPTDRPNRFASLSSPIAADIAEIAAWWQREDATRVPRFDLFAFPGCTSRFGMLDLGVVRLRQDTFAYQGPLDGFRRLVAEAAATTRQPGKTLVYYDGPEGDRATCGRATPRVAVAVVYLEVPSGCGAGVGVGGELAVTAAHELTHILGAVPSQAPNMCPASSGHVCDNSGDLMDPYNQAGSPLSAIVLDVNHDDYYAHSGSWLDVQDSEWLIHLPQRSLSVQLVSRRGGAGTVVSRPAAISCPDRCEAVLDEGFEVTLVPGPDRRSTFVGWEGSCTGADLCRLTLGAPATVRALFARARETLTVRVSGKGLVTSSPVGIRCPRRCKVTLDRDATVRLTPVPARGYRFLRWSGDCTGTRACTVTVTAGTDVRAVFARG